MNDNRMDKTNAAIFEMTRRATMSRALDALKRLWPLMPFGKEVMLATGEFVVVRPFVEPRIGEDGRAEFGVDIEAADRSWHLECFFRNTGWGAVPAAEMKPIEGDGS